MASDVFNIGYKILGFHNDCDWQVSEPIIYVSQAELAELEVTGMTHVCRWNIGKAWYYPKPSQFIKSDFKSEHDSTYGS
jgi:hypothetical protein